jgi:dipeptidyl-peptidase-3
MRYEPGLNQRFNMVADAMYSYLPESITLLGYPEAGHVSQYYPASPTITKEEIAKVHEITGAEFSPENTRLVKSGIMGANGQLKETYNLLVASAEKNHSGKVFELDGRPAVQQISGDHSEEMTKIVQECDAAVDTALNETQKQMFQEYSNSFRTGSIEAHKLAQKHWVQDKGPKVECNLGFIETYRDPHGIRAEWEGFVSMVNQEQTKKFGELVARAGEFIPRLPWGDGFEKDAFLKPDFTSLEVLSFCTSGIPAGVGLLPQI